MPAIEQLVAEALVERQAELRALVRDAVDAELQRLISALVATEIEQRQNGSEAATQAIARDGESAVSDDTAHDAESSDEAKPHESAVSDDTPLSTKQCSSCSRQLSLDHFLRSRSRCRDCRTAERRAYRQRQRERAASDDEVPHPATPRRDTRRVEMRIGGVIGPMQIAAAEQRREQIATARANGVEYVERDGRTFTVLHLPDSYAPRTTATAQPRSLMPDTVDVIA